MTARSPHGDLHVVGDAAEQRIRAVGFLEDRAGYAGLYRYAGGSSAQAFDDVKIGHDNNADADILDAGDDVQVDDDFSSNVMTLTYDNTLDTASAWPRHRPRHHGHAARPARRQGQAGNLTLDTPPAALRRRSRSDRQASLVAASQGLTDDGVLKFKYDAWNP